MKNERPKPRIRIECKAVSYLRVSRVAFGPMVALLFLSHQPPAAAAPQENEAASSERAESVPPNSSTTKSYLF